jgi:hypothetical protein
LLVFFLVAFLPVATVVAVNGIGFIGYRQTAKGSDVANERITKLEASSGVELLMLGDSSLRAAIDDEAFSRFSGYETLSLPLTGRWGYAGSLALLERVLERENPSTVLFVHTTDMFGREVADFGYFLASDRRLLAMLTDAELAKSVLDNLTSTKNFDRWRKTWKRRWFGEDPARVAARQEKATRSIRDDLFNMADHQAFIQGRMKLNAINPAKIKYLERLAAICQAEDLRCLYAHGPMARPLLGPVQAFLEDVDPIITSLGFELLPFTPVPMEYADIGNTEDHVAIERKETFTRRFAELMAPHLEGQRPVRISGRN